MGSSNRKKVSRTPKRLGLSGSGGGTALQGGTVSEAETLLVPLVDIDAKVCSHASVGDAVRVMASPSDLEVLLPEGRLGSIAPAFAAAVRHSKLRSGVIESMPVAGTVTILLGA
jgi:hypothetical protein